MIKTMDKFIPAILLVLLQVGYCLTDSCSKDTDCADGKICDDNNCYNESSRVDCSDGISYCYKPTQCCGISTCCSAKSQCCGWNTCCPLDSVCCSDTPAFCCEHGSTCCGYQTCCGAGSICKDRTCVSDNSVSFKHWYIFLILFPVFIGLAIIIKLIRRRMIAARITRTRDAGLSVQADPGIHVQQDKNYGYDQPMGQGWVFAGQNVFFPFHWQKLVKTGKNWKKPAEMEKNPK